MNPGFLTAPVYLEALRRWRAPSSFIIFLVFFVILVIGKGVSFVRLGELVEALGLEALVPGDPNREVAGGYVSDLLSDVMAHARSGAIWVTIQTHQNVVAVASLLSLAGVVVAGGYRPDAGTLAKAAEEGVPVYAAADSSFAVAGRLYGLGLR